MKRIYSTFILLAAVSFSQAQISDRWWVTSDAFLPHSQPHPFTVITTPDGYDNFDMGVDNAESSIANNPNNPLWFFTGWNGNPIGTTGTHHTETGYDPFLTNNPSLPGTFGDPWAAYDSLGNLFYINLDASGPSGTWVVKSTDNGLTWGPAVPGCTGFDRENIAADQTGGPYANYVYCGETSSGGASVFRSIDHGLTFQSMTVLTPHSLPGFMLAVGPNGNIQGGCVYAVTYTYTGNFFPQTYNFHRSTNGGLTWQSGISTITGIGFSGIDGGAGRGSINGIRTRAYPMIAADNSYGPFRGRFYCCWAMNPGGTSGGHPDIYLKYSTDLGSTWSATVTVNDNPGTTSDDWFPAIWCDKLTGYLYVKWYSDQVNPSSFQVNVYASHSTNGGVSFLPSQRITNQTWPYPNVGPCSGCVGNYRGDYDGIVSNGKAAMAAWFDGRNATWGSYTGYYPDFAMRVNPNTLSVTNQSDSAFSFISVPGVKNYTDRVRFTAAISPTPVVGTITLTFLNRNTGAQQDSLTSYPDSLRFRVRTSGGVLPTGAYTITVTGSGSNGTPVHKRIITLNVGLLGMIGGNEIPDKFYLYQNYPNPFNASSKLKVQSSKLSRVSLRIYDLLGRFVMQLLDKELQPGTYYIEFDGNQLPGGIYFCKMKAGEFEAVRKMMLIK